MAGCLVLHVAAYLVEAAVGDPNDKERSVSVILTVTYSTKAQPVEARGVFHEGLTEPVQRVTFAQR